MAICPNCGEDNPERAKFCLECARSLKDQPAPPQEARKAVTIVFCDLVGSTSLGERLDSESLREVMDRYFTEMKAVLERHGGIVEKYIGDAIMAIFGLPRAHEDDALRAVRAVSEMSVTLERLNAELEHDWGMSLANRTGVNTGEVVVGDPSSGQRLATGDTVNVAARLEQAAPANRVLLGEATYRLVRGGVSVEAVEPLQLKGKSDRLAAFRLVEVMPEAEGIARRLDTTLVGRSDELAALLEPFYHVVLENRCRLVTVLGEPGVGKSRLIMELAEHLPPEAAVLKGRCLSYGEGITFWPLAEIVRQAAAIGDEDSAGEARRKVGDLLLGVEGGIADRVASVIGLSAASFPIEESYWAARRLLEHLARSQPLVVIFEDIHWAEPTFLDWIGHVVDHAQGPLLVVCAARRELRDQRPSWQLRSANASLIDLQPLSASHSDSLIDNLLGGSAAIPEIRSRITAAAQGNPLFVEQMLSMWIEDETLYRDDGLWWLRTDASTSIPPTISALLAARLDHLVQEERVVVASASVVGQVFYLGAVAELCPVNVKPRISTILSSLEEKQFVRPDPSTFGEEQAFAFRHVLIRDVAYEAILKRTRAELHERFASWLERVTGERIGEYEEIAGFHLEQAFLHFSMLGRREERIEEVGKRAAQHLSSAGKRALDRGDMSGAKNLLERAVRLLPQDDEGRANLLPDLAVALIELGDFSKAEVVLEEALDIAGRCGYARVSAHARLEQVNLRLFSDPEGAQREGLREAEQAISLFEQLNDDRGLARAWNLAGHCQTDIGRMAASELAWWRAARHAERAKAHRELVESLSWLALTAPFGPTPVLEAVKLSDRVLDRAPDDHTVHAYVLDGRCVLEAMQGDFDRARDAVSGARALYQELGLEVIGANLSQNAGFVEMLADEPLTAVGELRRGYEILDRLGEKGFLSTLAAYLAHVFFTLGNFRDAREFTFISESTASSDDLLSQILWRSARGKVVARLGDLERGEKFTRESVEIAANTDFLNHHADALSDLATVLLEATRLRDAAGVTGTALSLYEEKGNIVSAAKARRLLEEISSSSSTRNHK
jgi:class 3 adenylate cyclase/tetratricopeptide (TPR) repeat protein